MYWLHRANNIVPISYILHPAAYFNISMDSVYVSQLLVMFMIAYVYKE